MFSIPRSTSRILLVTAILMLLPASGHVAAQSTQPEGLSTDEQTAVVERIGQMLNERYVFPDVAASSAEHLLAQLEAGEFNGVTEPAAFAARLTESLQSVNNDKHMRVRVRRAERVTMQRENPARAMARRRAGARQQNYGFEKVERLDGNVGYIEMRHFAGTPDAMATASAAMNFLANVDALIFDMRRNGGGSPEMVQYVTSYLFEERTHLNSLYWREGDRTIEFWTLDDVPGPRLGDVPVFILTSSRTFSAAEEFTYNLSTRKRATLVGETTGGGANPGGSMPINERFEIFIPTGRAVNPITGINWEGTGIKPDVEVAADDAFDTAIELAREAAESRRTAEEERVDVFWQAFGESHTRSLSLADEGKVDDACSVLAASLKNAHDAGLIGEDDINMLGYQTMGQGQVALGIAVFKFNVSAFPKSANVYDSLGEAYMHDGQTRRAIKNYERSLELDPANENARVMIEQLRSGA